MKYPLAGLCVALCCGIITAAPQKVTFTVLCLLTLLFLLPALFIKQNIKFNILILGASFFLGAALIKNSQTLPNAHILKLAGEKNIPVCLTGVVDSDPVFSQHAASFILKTETIYSGELRQKTCGRVLVRLFAAGVFSYGDRLVLRGNLSRPFSFPGGFDYRNYLKHQDIYLILRVGQNPGTVKSAGKNGGSIFKSFSIKLKHRLKKVITDNLSAFSAAVLNALILGDRQDLPAYFVDILMKLGTIHIIAISGFNVGIVAFIILLILKIVKLPRNPRYLIALALLIIYCILTGSSAPVVRATIMAGILISAYFFQRQINIYNSLSAAVIVILAFNPWQLFEISFQLSFLSVVSIVWLSPKIKSVFPEKLDRIPPARFLILTFSTSTAAWVGLLPLIAYYFKTVSVISVPANMIVVPYSAVITVAGFSFALISICFPALAPALAATNELFIRILFKIHCLLAAIPGAYYKLPEFPPVYILFYYAALILVFNFSNIRRRIFTWQS